MDVGDDEEELSPAEPRDDDFDEGEEPTTPEIQKKTRPSRACDNCRKKKVKCEGNPCANCRHHNVECTFNTQTRKRPQRKDHKYIARIEERLKRIETRFAQDAPEAWAAFQGDERGSPGDPSRQAHSRSRRSGGISEPTFTAPAGALILTDNMSSGAYLGPTSPWTFLEHTRAHARKQLNLNFISSSTHEFLAVNAFQAGLVKSIQHTVHVTRPSREESIRYIDAWFTSSKSVHGCLHRPSFEASATANIQNQDFKCLHDCVVALGACVEGDVQRSQQFLQLVWASFVDGIFNSQSLHTVQIAQLLALLLFLLGRYALAYVVIGHAARLALANGMHRGSSVPRQDGSAMNVLEIEERRRTFWSIYCLDTMISFVMGRPPTIMDSDVDMELPNPIQDSRITDEGILPEEIEAQTEEYLHESLRTLSRLLRKIYNDLYSATTTKVRSHADLISTMRELQTELSNWRNALSTNIRPFLLAENPDNFVGASSEKLYLSMAYYFCQCLVHRPALLETIQHKLGDVVAREEPRSPARRGRSPAKQFVNPRTQLSGGSGTEELEIFVDQCVIAARDLLNLIYSSTNSQFSLLPPCIITAGSILVDNMMRDIFAKTTDGDYQLLGNISQVIQENTEAPLSRAVLEALHDLRLIARLAFQPTSSPSSLPRVPEQQTQFFQPSTSYIPYQTPGDRFVAGPMYDTTFLSTSLPSTSFQPTSSINQSYPTLQPAYPFQFATTEGGATSTLRPQIGPAQVMQQSSGIQPHPQSGMEPHWTRNSVAEIAQPPIQASNTQQYTWATGTPDQWEHPPSPSRPARGTGHKKRPSRARGASR